MDSPATREEIGQYIKAWQDTFFIAAHDWNFKDGAFKREITPSTNVIDGFDIFIASAKLSKDEKTVLSDARASMVKVLVTGSRMTSWELTMEMMTFTERVTNIFETDSKKRGMYVPPTMIQSFDANGKVVNTFEFANDGVKTTAGGEVGVNPSAPEPVKQNQRAANESLFGNGEQKHAQGDGGESITSYSRRSSSMLKH